MGSLRTWTDEQLILAAKESNHINDIPEKLGIALVESNLRTIRKYIKLLNIDTTHFNNEIRRRNKEHLKYSRDCAYVLPEERIFCENSKVSPKYIRAKILKDKIFEYACSICSINSWHDKELSLHIDHINGVNNDHRLENLRWLCPNCHSQTSTYSGRNRKSKYGKAGVIKNCIDCGSVISKAAKRCSRCNTKIYKEKIIWPNLEEICNLISNHNVSYAARQLKCSGNAIRKHLRKNGMSTQELIKNSKLKKY